MNSEAKRLLRESRKIRKKHLHTARYVVRSCWGYVVSAYDDLGEAQRKADRLYGSVFDRMKNEYMKAFVVMFGSTNVKYFYCFRNASRYAYSICNPCKITFGNETILELNKITINWKREGF
jgi:hypothetical protein